MSFNCINKKDAKTENLDTSNSNEINLALYGFLPEEIKDHEVAEVPSSSWEEGFNNWVTNVATSIDKDLLDIVNPKIERIIVKAALEKSNGKKNEAAILLGLGRNTLAKKMKELGI